jgi:hypothetical protein
MAHSGIYKVKNREKYKGNPDNVIYRSSWERRVFNWCDRNSEIKNWSSEEIVIPYKYDITKKAHRYFPDLKITFKSGKTILVEIKPHKETEKPKYPGKRTQRYLNEATTYVKNQNKWEAAEKYAKDRGWDFQIWTEHTLDKMGIMKKGFKKMKPLKPFSKKKS